MWTPRGSQGASFLSETVPNTETRRNPGPGSTVGRGPSGTRRFGSRARPLPPTKEATGRRVDLRYRRKSGEGVDSVKRCVRTGQVGLRAARDPATRCGRIAVRLAGKPVQGFAPGSSQAKPRNQLCATAS